ncbi:MAG: hypothetical protein ACN2B6_00255 [Rickettsiales bacterium]
MKCFKKIGFDSDYFTPHMIAMEIEWLASEGIIDVENGFDSSSLMLQLKGSRLVVNLDKKIHYLWDGGERVAPDVVIDTREELLEKVIMYQARKIEALNSENVTVINESGFSICPEIGYGANRELTVKLKPGLPGVEHLQNATIENPVLGWVKDESCDTRFLCACYLSLCGGIKSVLGSGSKLVGYDKSWASFEPLSDEDKVKLGIA